MPNAAPRPCIHPGCGKLVHNESRCDQHQKAKRKISDEVRGSSSERGYGYKWQQASKGFLGKHPTCQCPECLEGELRLRPSQVVDHIVPHKLKEAIESGDAVLISKAKALFWDRNNWMAMNKQCHDKKTAIQDGGFGRGGAGQKSPTFAL